MDKKETVKDILSAVDGVLHFAPAVSIQWLLTWQLSNDGTYSTNLR